MGRGPAITEERKQAIRELAAHNPGLTQGEIAMETVPVDAKALHLLVNGAVRYYLGRSTIAVWGVCRDLAAMLPRLEEGTKCCMERDIIRWLDEHPDFSADAVIDDAEPWRELLGALRGEHGEA